MSEDGGHDSEAGAGLLPSIPPMPSPARSELYGIPYLPEHSTSGHYNIGWQHHRKAGPSFVITRSSLFGTDKVVERFPLTEQGWATAWRALTSRNPGATDTIAARLAKRAANSRAAEALASLDREALCNLQGVSFTGGSGNVQLSKDQSYDLRFLPGRIMISRRHSADAIVEVPYRDVESVEIAGPGQVSKTSGNMAALIVGFGLLGALLGLLIFGLVGLLLGALLFGLIGAVIGSGSMKIETIVRIRTTDAEFYFVDSMKRPEALRIELSEPLMAIDRARAAQTADEPAQRSPRTVSDELTKLASLLQRDLITQDEFEQLKARLIAESQ